MGPKVKGPAESLPVRGCHQRQGLGNKGNKQDWGEYEWVFMATGTEGLPEFGRAGEEVADLRTLQAMQLMAGAGVSGESKTQPSNQGLGEAKESACD